MSEVQNTNLSEQEIVRRQKLEKLTSEGNNPYEKTKFPVTAHSAEIKDNFEFKFYSSILSLLIKNKLNKDPAFCFDCLLR